MGESIVEGTLTKWLKKVGDKVERDEPLFEISTDKVDSEIPAPAAGTLAEMLVQEGATVSINTIVGRIDEGGGAVAAAPAPAPQPAAAPPPPPPPPAPVAAPAPLLRHRRLRCKLHLHLPLLPRLTRRARKRLGCCRRSCVAWRVNMASI
jgi:pyruvate/2-oxoglutarate dehydrogenase complex dihydrolipoamide acyltransferase (E2) component